jgi:hypothetical protein
MAASRLPFLALLALALAVGCGTFPSDTNAPAADAAVRVELTPERVTFASPGETVQLTALLYDGEGRGAGGRGFSYQVFDGNVVRLGSWSRYSPGVRITAEGSGTTMVRVVAFPASGPSLVDTTFVTVEGVPGARRYQLRYETDFLDFDADTVVSCPRACAFPDGTDLKVLFDPAGDVHAIVAPNGGAGVEIAEIAGGEFVAVSAADAGTATFTSTTSGILFDRTRVILIRTDQGAVFKLGNPVESEMVVEGVRFEAAPLN